MRRGLLLIPVLLAGCSSGHADRGPDRVPLSPSPVGHSVSVDGSDRRAATLSVESGTSSLVVTTADLHGDLVQASTPATSHQVPHLATTRDGTVHLTFSSTSDGGSDGPVDVVLDRAVTWSLTLGGGSSSTHLDARNGSIALVDLTAGVSMVTLDLPAPHGTQTVREGGGSSELTVTTPKGTPVRVRETGGLGSLAIDDQTHGGLGGNMTFDDPGWASAADRLDVELMGGVSSARVDHRM